MKSQTQSLNEFLEHSGVKGMKWGVRNDAGHEGESAKTKTIAKLDKKYEKSFNGTSGYFKMHNEVAGEINKRLGALNDRHPGVDTRDASKKKLNDAYMKDYESVVKDSAAAAIKSFGTNASGTGRVKLTQVGQGEDAWFQASWEDIKHADSNVNLKIVPKYKNGRIVGQTISNLEKSISHVDGDIVEDALAHFGIKGMRWGRRKAIGDGETVVTQKKPGTKLKTAGGKKVPAHEDAIKSAASRQRAKASTTDALSNQELQALVTRMNLEQQYTRLASTPANQSTLKRGQEGLKKLVGMKSDLDKTISDPFVNEQAVKVANEVRLKKVAGYVASHKKEKKNN